MNLSEEQQEHIVRVIGNYHYQLLFALALDNTVVGKTVLNNMGYVIEGLRCLEVDRQLVSTLWSEGVRRGERLMAAEL